MPVKRGQLCLGLRKGLEQKRERSLDRYHTSPFAPHSRQNAMSGKLLHLRAKSCIENLSLWIKLDGLLVKASVLIKTDITQKPTIKDLNSAFAGTDQKNSTRQILAVLSSYCTAMVLISPERQYFFNKAHLPEMLIFKILQPYLLRARNSSQPDIDLLWPEQYSTPVNLRSLSKCKLSGNCMRKK